MNIFNRKYKYFVSANYSDGAKSGFLQTYLDADRKLNSQAEIEKAKLSLQRFLMDSGCSGDTVVVILNFKRIKA